MKQLYVVGIGPGKHELLTIEAAEVLAACDTIVGYNVYVDLVREYYPDKEYLATGMTREVQRCRLALEAAEGGRTTAMICSGDAGVYGMAGIMLELGNDYPEVDIEIIPGITAALSGAAVLGAPLGHDFSVISLSDLLTPWEKIVKRIECAAMSDMAIVIYNPSSRKRSDYLAKACDIMLQYISPDTVCGYVRNIGREGEKHEILPLKELKAAEVDMFTTVFVGNSSTKYINGRMVTPRGYQL
ncbi:MAG: precorrin-3B C(17)-methyltransferase [Wujia sp.]